MPIRLDHKTLLRIHCATFLLVGQSYGFVRPVNIQLKSVLGDLSEGDPPVPIPNTVVKPLSPDGTAQVTVWESRKLPGFK